MELLLWLLLFIGCLAVLILASHFFVGSAEIIGTALGMPRFVVGVVIVGIGTSLPELVSSLFALFSYKSEIVIGNVLGSNIANIFLVLGIVGILAGKLTIKYDLLRFDLPFLLGSTLLLALMILDTQLSVAEGGILFLCLIVYLFNSIKGGAGKDKKVKKTGLKSWILLFVSPLFIFLSAKFLVDSVIAISEILDIGTEVIAMSAVALGTSLPEVLVTITAARRGNLEMAIGNIIGSNIFNIFAVMGIPGLVSIFLKDKFLIIPETILYFSLPACIAATLLCIVITLDKKINRWEGILLLVFYIFFIGKILNLL